MAIMSPEKMRQVAWIGEQFVRGPITGVIVSFHGLGHPAVKAVPSYEENEWASAGGLVVMPYYGPWNWMNRSSRRFVDELITAVYAHFNLSPNVPLLLTGGSMGGHGSLLYARYAAHPITACAALYPVCDLHYHFDERKDLPRTIHHAFQGYEEDYEVLFREHSPLQQVARMPRVPYLIVQGDADKLVNKAAHSDKMAAAMHAQGHDLEYIEVPGMGHTEPLYYGVYRRYIEFIKEHLGQET